MATETHGSPEEGAECLACMEDLTCETYVEYATEEGEIRVVVHYHIHICVIEEGRNSIKVALLLFTRFCSHHLPACAACDCGCDCLDRWDVETFAVLQQLRGAPAAEPV